MARARVFGIETESFPIEGISPFSPEEIAGEDPGRLDGLVKHALQSVIVRVADWRQPFRFPEQS